jgi:hypothetical protein
MANTDRPIIPPQQPIPVLAYDAPSLHLPAIVVCCRMLAIALAVPAIEPIVSLVGGLILGPILGKSMTTPQGLQVIFIHAISALCWAVPAVVCWWQAPWLSKRIFKGISRDGGGPLFGNIAADQVLAVLLIAVGVYEIADAIPWFARLIDYLRYGILTQEERRYMITSVLRIIVGLWLVLGTSGILKMIRSHTGRWRDDPNSEEQVDKGKEGPNV